VIANTWDAVFYHETATAIAAGEGYVFQGRPTAFFPPGFPVFLAAAYRVGGASPRSGQIANLLASLGILAAVAAAVGLTAGPVAGRWCAVLLALEPSQWIMPAFLMSETACTLGVAGMILFLVRWSQGGGWIPVVGAGACAVAAGFTRGLGFLLLPTVAAAILWAGARSRGETVRALVLAGAVCAVAVGAWALRNDRVLGEPVLVSTNVGVNLLVGNNPNARGGRADPPGGVPGSGDELADENEAFERVRSYVRENPGRALAVLPLKAARLWAFGPAVTYRAELAAKLGRVAGGVAVGLAQAAHLALLAAAAAFLWRTRRGTEPKTRVLFAIVLASAAVWTLAHVPFFGGARFLFPIHPLVAAAAAAWSARPVSPRAQSR